MTASHRTIFSSLIGATCLAMLAGSVSCADLYEVELGVCGNHIHEPEFGEDCDGTAVQFGDSASCGEPNGSAPCRLACNAQAAEPGCPSGWGCGTDGVCRQPSGVLEGGTLPGEVRAIGDLDGDGRDDVVLRGPTGGAEVAFFTEGRNLAEVFVDPARRQISDDPAVLPIVSRMTTDGIDDLALPVIGDDVTIRVFMGSSARTLENPFVELVTVPFGATGDVWMRTVFNPLGFPQSVCAVGGCTQSLLLGKTKVDETRYAVLMDRQLQELFRLAEDRRRQNTAVARWHSALSCDVLAVSYRYAPASDSDSGSPGNLIDLFPLCKAPGELNQSPDVEELGTVPALTSVSVSDTDATHSLIVSGSGDIDGNGFPDLLINITDNDPTTLDDGQTYALYGMGDGHFNSRVDLTGDIDVADRSRPLLLGHSWATTGDQAQRIESATWPRAMADINSDGRADFLLTAGVVALSNPNNIAATCVIAGESVLAGPGYGSFDEPVWGYSCVLVGDQGLLDASELTQAAVSRDWLSSDSLATRVDLHGDGQPGFAAIDKNKIVYTGQPTDHTPIDLLDLIWIDPATSQLTLETIESERIEQIAAGDIDGDFAIDLLLGGNKLEVILGAPFDLSRATGLSPAEFDQLQVFSEGRPSASVGAERDGRLTIFRDGQWPALALIEPGDCATPEECHVRFATGALGDPLDFAWAVGIVRSSVGGGLRLLRAIEGEADIGPAYDSASVPLVPLSHLGLFLAPESTTVISMDLDVEGDKAAIDEAIVIGRTDTGVELAILRPYLAVDASAPLCSPEFVSVAADPETGDGGQRAVCFDIADVLHFPGVARAHPGSKDPFVEVADADGDGNLDLSWVTVDNHVMLLLGGNGTFSAEDLIQLTLPAMPEPEESGGDPTGGGQQEPAGPDGEAPDTPTRIDWIRWIEFDGSYGREIVSSDVLGSGLMWGINVEFDEALLEPRGFLPLESNETRKIGYSGDFDGDGVDDIALGKLVLFGQPVND